MDREARAQLQRLFGIALARVDAGAAVRRVLRRRGSRLEIAGRELPAGARLVVLAVGKAAVPMARALEEVAGDRIAAGLVVTRDARGDALERLPLREAGHPVPDERGVRAAREAVALVSGTGPRDALLVLLSGGASALLTLPAAGLGLEDLRQTTGRLLRAGADIEALNTLRKHLTEASGGRLALRAGAASVEVLAISDVPGDDPSTIGSGPFTPDPTTWADALSVVEAHGLADALPERVLLRLREGAAGRHAETPKPGCRELARVRYRVLASNRDALEAIRGAAAELGLRPVRVASELRGEARAAGRRLAALARSSLGSRPGGLLLLAGGETTVTVRGGGRGGRSQELALAAALALQGSRGITLLAAGTDGSDGPTAAAGAFADGGSVARGRERGVDAARCLQENDAHGFFSAEGGLLVTGPTGTNVRDLVLVRVVSDAAGRDPGAASGGR